MPNKVLTPTQVAQMRRLYIDERLTFEEIARRYYCARSTVAKYLADAPRHNARTPEEDRRFVDLYRAGFSVERITRETGRDKKTISLVLDAHGIERTRRPAATRLPHDEIARTIELYQAGHSLREVADMLGRHTTAIRVRLQNAGVPLRKRSHAQTIQRLACETATSPRPREILAAIADGHNRTTQIAARIGIVDSSASTWLCRLEAAGITRRRRDGQMVRWEPTGVDFERAWTDYVEQRRRDALAVAAEAALPEPESVPKKPGNAEALPIEPFRAWVRELLARERRAAIYLAIEGERDVTSGMTAVATRLGMSERRLYALVHGHEQERISLAVADRALTRSGEPVFLWDLWPDLATVALDDDERDAKAAA